MLLRAGIGLFFHAAKAEADAIAEMGGDTAQETAEGGPAPEDMTVRLSRSSMAGNRLAIPKFGTGEGSGRLAPAGLR